MSHNITSEHYAKLIKRAMDIHPNLTIDGFSPNEMGVSHYQPLSERRKCLEKNNHLENFIKLNDYFKILKPRLRYPIAAFRVSDRLENETGLHTRHCIGIVLIAAMYNKLGVMAEFEGVWDVIFYDRALDQGDSIL